MNQRVFTALLVVGVSMFVFAPFMIAWAPYESTMGLVQKIFYFHVPSWFMMFLAVFICGIASGIYLLSEKPAADRLAVASAELAVLFGLMGLVTGPLWARKAWGVWWQWDARLTLAIILEMIFCSYILLRQYGGPGSEKLAAGLAIFGTANVPFVYISVNMWRTVHPTTNVVPTLGPGMFGAFWWCVAAYLVLFPVMLAARIQLEKQLAQVEELHLELETD